MPDKDSMRDYFQNATRQFPRPQPGSNSPLSQLRELVAAIRFLTILPVPGSAQLFDADDDDIPDLIIGSAYFPLVGLLLAALLWLVVLATNMVLPSIVLGALLVVIQTLLTGGLHLDGLMDSFDGLFGGTTPDRQLEIMRDSRVGSFGVLSAFCVLLFRFAVFASMRPHLLTLALFLVLPVARWAMVLTVNLFPGARLSGLGSAFRRTITLQRLLAAGVTSLVIVLIAGRLAGLLVWIVGTLVAIALGALINRRLGGLTGDSYGAVEEITEIILLLLIILLHNWF
jgi:adenosylcobinamide-GDP ribazoletransferase